MVVSPVIQGGDTGVPAVWVGFLALSDAMMQVVEGIHMGFLRNITGKQARHQTNRNWETQEA